MSNTILKLDKITKKYPGVIALNCVSLEFEKGEVHAILGENGAGKSTLIKTIDGAVVPEDGKICVDNKEFTSLSPYQSKECGIEVVYQEFNLIDSENISFEFSNEL
ncbi:MAG: ATP-binding cassette domain-containing protein [Lachnospirales bacterium]